MPPRQRHAITASPNRSAREKLIEAAIATVRYKGFFGNLGR